MRAANSPSTPSAQSVLAVQAWRAGRVGRAGRRRTCPAGGRRLSMGSPLGRSQVPWKTLGRKPAPQLLALPLGRPRSSGSLMTTKAGRLPALAAETVGRPGTDAGHAHAGGSRVDHEQRRAVVVGLGVARVQERHLVHVPGEVREQVGDPGAALRHGGPRRTATSSGARPPGKKPVLVSKPGELGAVAHRQFGLVVPGVDLAGAAVHEQPDDGLGAGGEVGRRGASGLGRAACAEGTSRPESRSRVARPSMPAPRPARGGRRGGEG
jgi:hypothetical protein